MTGRGLPERPCRRGPAQKGKSEEEQVKEKGQMLPAAASWRRGAAGAEGDKEA